MTSDTRRKLFMLMQQMGYSKRFCQLISESLNTDFTAARMIGYLKQFDDKPPMEEVADEMLAILSDRDRIVEKKITEQSNENWNEFLRIQKCEPVDYD